VARYNGYICVSFESYGLVFDDVIAEMFECEIGSEPGRFSNFRASGCRPSMMASTISGARNAHERYVA
jgi:hypothetical protein